MRFIKPFLVGITGLFIVITLLSLLIPAHIKVSRAIVINAPADTIAAQIKDLRNWKNWQPLFKSEAAVITFPAPTGNAPAYCDISYNNKIVHVQVTGTDSLSVRFLLSAAGEDDIENELTIIPVKQQDQFEVEWKGLTILPWYPWEKFYGIFIDKITGPSYDTSLAALKNYIESK